MSGDSIFTPKSVVIFRPLIWNGVGMCLCPNCENEIVHEPYVNPSECTYCKQKLLWDIND